METRLAFIFVAEIERQCSFTLTAAKDLEAALKKYHALNMHVLAGGEVEHTEVMQTQERVWSSVQAMLISLANVSKILWSQKHQARSSYLRQLLRVADDSALASRKLRNHFEHIDERLEHWYNAHGRNKTSVDGAIGPANGYTATQGLTFFRFFDTTLFAITFCEELYKLDPMVSAAHQLRGETEKAMELLLQKDRQDFDA